MVQIALIYGDVVVCHHLERYLQNEHVHITTWEGIQTPDQLSSNARRADFLFLDSQLLQRSPIDSWKTSIQGKIILLTTFAGGNAAIQLLENKKINGVLTKTIDRTKWQNIIYHTSEIQTPSEQYFLTHLIPRILQWDTNHTVLEKGTIALEAEVICLLDAGYDVERIARTLKVDIEQIKQLSTIIGDLRSA